MNEGNNEAQPEAAQGAAPRVGLDVMTLAVREAAHEVRLCKMVEWVHDEDDEYKTAERFAAAILASLAEGADND